MDIFEFAMKMEQDGRVYYEKMAKQAGQAALKKVLLDLAQDEIKHYQIFKSFKAGNISAGVKMQTAGTEIVKRAKNVFQRLASGKEKLNFGNDILAAWREAQKIEKKSEDFYREKSQSAGNDEVKKIILLIADEEHKHWALIESVLQFLDRPQQWLENAEWNHLEEY